MPPARKTVLVAAEAGGKLLNPYLRIIFESPTFQRQARLHPLGLLPTRAGNLHLHWPEYLLYGKLSRRFAQVSDAAYWTLLRTIDRVKRRGGKVIWTAHNLEPHGYPSPHGEATYRRWAHEIFQRVDTVITMSPSTRRQVRHAIPALDRARFETIPHPHYRHYYVRAGDPRAVRARHGIPAAAHLTCAAGLIRPYKRIPDLIAAFAASARSDEYLLIAGPCHDHALIAEVEHQASLSPRVRLQLGNLSDADFAGAVRAADLFVANFGGVLNSGSVIAAVSLDTPVLAPRLGALLDLQQQVGDAWLALFDDALDATALRRHVDRIRATSRPDSPDLEPNDPEAVVQAHLNLYI